MDVKLEVFKRVENKDLHLVQNLTMGETDFNWLMQLRKQLVIATENFGREENLSSVLIPTMPKDIDEQLKLAHKGIDVVDQANRKIYLPLLRHNVEKPECSYARTGLFAKKEEEEKSEQNVYVVYKHEDFLYLLEGMDSFYDEAFTNKPICNVL